ncbi:Pr6Pr family membrane protein [Aquipuribacter sp. MA13-6]|uniref:Pr6Pr family membrane protein n=1 Tax=unclassified Aquipuribacter TaxID=2635084 RepID=UPI003EE85C97
MIAPVRNEPLARAWFLLTAAVVVVAVAVQVPLSAAVETGYFSTPLARGLNVFAFFTIQSNLLVAASALLTALDPDRDTRLRRVLRLTSLVAITVTGVVYHSVLAGLVELSGWGYVADVAVHTVVPVLAVLGWVLFGPRGRTTWGVVALSAVFPVLWLTFTLVRGPLVGGFWPYPFVDVDELGWAQVLLNCGGVAVLLLGLAAVAHGADRLLRRGTGGERTPVGDQARAG